MSAIHVYDPLKRYFDDEMELDTHRMKLSKKSYMYLTQVPMTTMMASAHESFAEKVDRNFMLFKTLSLKASSFLRFPIDFVVVGIFSSYSCAIDPTKLASYLLYCNTYTTYKRY